MMPGYLDSPMYQRMMAETLRGSQRGPQYPGEATANALATMLQAYQMKQFQNKDEDKTRAYGEALLPAPADQVNITPQVTEIGQPQERQQAGAYAGPSDSTLTLAKLLKGGNADALAEFVPQYAKQQMENDAQTNAPITPYQRMQLDRQAHIDDPKYQAEIKGLPGPAPQPTVGMTPEAEAQALRLEEGKRAGTQAFTSSENEKDRAARSEAAAIRAGGAHSNVQSVIPLGDGTMLTMYRDGTKERTTLDGVPVMGARNDPKALFNQSAATAGGKAAGTAAEALPTVTANFDIINKTLDAFDDEKVRAQAGKAIGFGGLLPKVPGFNSDFHARMEQLQGETFLQAFNTLRGGGQITEAEGSKATVAIARLSKSQSPDEFYASLRDAKATFKALFAAAKTRAARGAVVPQMQGGLGASAGGIDDLVNQYKTKAP